MLDVRNELAILRCLHPSIFHYRVGELNAFSGFGLGENRHRHYRHRYYSRRQLEVLARRALGCVYRGRASFKRDTLVGSPAENTFGALKYGREFESTIAQRNPLDAATREYRQLHLLFGIAFYVFFSLFQHLLALS